MIGVLLDRLSYCFDQISISIAVCMVTAFLCSQQKAKYACLRIMRQTCHQGTGTEIGQQDQIERKRCPLQARMLVLEVQMVLRRFVVRPRLYDNMSSQVEANVMLILNSVQLGLYGLTAILGCIRLVKAYSQPQSFIRLFFAIVAVITAIQLALQIYQIVAEVGQQIIIEPVLIIVNIYAMLFEAAAIFVLADYWGETSEILTKESTEEQIKNKRHWVRITILIIWGAIFTAFVIWAEVTNSFDQNTTNASLAVLALGCQGLTVVLVLWANILQIMKGYKMSVALKRYEDWVSSLSIRKVQFCCLFWLSSTFNLLRSLFLIAATLIIEFGYEDISYEWIFGYVYSFTNIPVLVIYFLGFSTKTEEPSKMSTLIQDNARDTSPRYKGETELSRSSRSSV